MQSRASELYMLGLLRAAATESKLVVNDQAEADMMNEHDTALYARVGLKPYHEWKVGDEYYYVP